MTSISQETILIPGPTFHIDLSPLDAFHPIHYSRRLLFFACPSPSHFSQQLSLLQTSLKALVQQCPILGGIISPLPKNSCTIIPGPGIELIVKDLRGILPTFAGLEAKDFETGLLGYDDLVPVPSDLGHPGHDRPFPALKIQFSAIDGGSILTYSMSHSVADGSATDSLIKILAAEIRAAQEESGDTNTTSRDSPAPIGLDRSVLSNLKSEREFDITEHPAYRWKTLSQKENVLPESLHPFAATAPELPILLHITPENLSKLKLDATPPGRKISTHDALCALIWRSNILLRSRRSPVPSSEDLMTKFFMPSDARKQLGLPDNYIGNSVYQLYAELPTSTVLSLSGLRHCAGAVRNAINAARPEVVRSFMAYYNGGKGKVSLDWQFTAPGALMVGVPLGTDWKSGSAMYADWGGVFGEVKSYRFPGGDGCVVLPKLRDGGAEVVVAVMAREVEVLKGDECFGRYL